MTLGLARAQTSSLPSLLLPLTLELDGWGPQEKGPALSLLSYHLSKAMSGVIKSGGCP